MKLTPLALTTLCVLGFISIGCGPSLAPSKPISQLTPGELEGHAVFVHYCAGCHYANSQDPLHGPGLEGVFRKRYLPSGAPANDVRVNDVIERGRGMMPAFGNTLDEQQLAQLLAYLHTL